MKTEITEMSLTPFRTEPRRFFLPTQPLTGGPPPPPECPTAEMHCTSVSAFLGKCGYRSCDTSDKKYYKTLTRVGTWSGTMTSDFHFVGDLNTIDDHTTTVASGTLTWIGIKEPTSDPPCQESTSVIGSLTRIFTCDHLLTNNAGGAVLVHNSGSNTWTCTDINLATHCPYPSGIFPDGGFSSGCLATTYCGLATCITVPNTCSGGVLTEQINEPPQSGDNCTVSGGLTQIRTNTVSDEYTTDELKSNTEGKLPEFSGYYDCDYPEEFAPESGQGCECESIYDLSDDEASFRRQKAKRKFSFSSVACVGMILDWDYMFTPKGSSTPMFFSSGGWAAAGGESETPEFDDPDITENGKITVDNITVDCSTCPVPGP